MFHFSIFYLSVFVRLWQNSAKKHFKELYKLVILLKSVLNLMVLPLSFLFERIKTNFFVCTKLMAGFFFISSHCSSSMLSPDS
jgi:hypothetical protein